MTEKPTIVLVPGSFHDPGCFDLLVDCLQKLNYPTKSVRLPSNAELDETKVGSFYEDAEAVREAVATVVDQGKDVFVFMHSYGALPGNEGLVGLGKQTRTTQKGGIVRFIYCSSFILPEGMPYMSFIQDHPEGFNESGWIKPMDSGLLYADKDVVSPILYSGVPPDLVTKAIHDLRYQQAATAFAPMTKCAWREIPGTLIKTIEDKAVPADAQQKMADMCEVKDVIEFPGGHSPFLSRPQELADVVDQIVQKYA